MSLERFRSQQKMILWVVAILLIPAFMLFGLGIGRGGSSQTLAKIDGKKVTAAEMTSFIKRMRAGGTQFAQLNLRSNAEITQVAVFMRLVEKAREMGLSVTEAEIGHDIRNNEMFKKDGAFDDETYKKSVRNFFGLEPAEYKQAVEEKLILQKLSNSLDGCTVVSPHLPYIEWAYENARVAYGIVTVNTDDFREEAEKAIADMDKAITEYAKANSTDPDLREQGRWVLEYIISRYDDMAAVNPSEDQLRRVFEDNVETKYKGKTYNDVKDEIKAEFIQSRKEGMASRRIGQEIDPVLVGLAASGGAVTADKVMNAATVTDGIRSGVSGEKGMTAMELDTHPVLGKCQDLLNMLRSIDRMTDSAAREKKVAELKANFNKKIEKMVGYRQPAVKKNLSNNVGVFKVRVVDYIPGVAKDPASNEDARKLIKDRLITEGALKLAKAEVDKQRKQIMSGDEKGLKIDEKVDAMRTLQYRMQYGYDSGLSVLMDSKTRAGAATEPTQSGAGYSFYILRGREIPSVDKFEQLPEKTRNDYLNRAMATSGRGMMHLKTLFEEINASGEIQLQGNFDAEPETGEKKAEDEA